MFFVKSKRARNVDDYETWLEGWVAPTLNAMDNSGDSFATVLIIDGTRVDDVRIYEDGIVPTVISRWGTGGGNMPAIAFDTYNQSVSDVSQTIKSHSANNENIGMVMTETTVRRLTPTECERLQGFPDGWTAERFDEKKQAVIPQADSNRYKQMGNAVAVPVVDWIVKRMVEQCG